MPKHEELKSSLKDALKNKEVVRLRVIRSILTALTNELVSQGKKPQEILSDNDVLKVIKRLAKQRQDSITQFAAGGRADLAEIEKEELAVLNTYLPQMMSLEEIRPIVTAKKIELGIEDKGKLGQLIGAVLKELQGQADGQDVKTAVEELFN